MSKVEITTPVGGRMVMGSLYEPQTTDLDGKPLTVRTGPNAGKPRVDYFFALAIPKLSETHWNQTEWGTKIWSVGHTGFPNGQADAPTFAWKVVDGDSQIPNRMGKKPCDRQGYPGHWVLTFSGGFAPKICNRDGSQYLLDKDIVQPGDFIQVFGSISDNGSQQQPGVYLNHLIIAHTGFGERIEFGVDAASVGFGVGTLPAGVSSTPVSTGFTPPVSGPPAPVSSPVVYPEPVVPHTSILTPPPAAPGRVMLPAANGLTYEQWTAAGWNDAQLIQHGKMAP